MFTINTPSQKEREPQNSAAQVETEGFLLTANRHIKNHNYDAAERALLDAIQEDPFHPTAHGRLGKVYVRQGRTEDGLNSLTRALEIDPQDRETILSCAEVFQSFGRQQDARLVLETYLSSHPDDEEIRQRLDASNERPPSETDSRTFDPAGFLNTQGEAQFGKGRLDYARACFEMALEEDPCHAAAYCNLGVVESHEGNYTKALEQLYRALELSPDDPEILLNCYLALKASGHIEAAVELMELYLRKGFGDDSTWTEYAQLQRQLGAGAWEPTGLTKDVAAIYIQTASALFDAGDHSGAATALERALAIDTQNPEGYYHLGRLLNEAGELDGARESLMKSMELDPDHQAAAQLLHRLAAAAISSESGAN